MTSLGSTVAWLPMAIARAAVVTPAPRASRHAAPERSSLVEIVAAEEADRGRHAEPAWSREVFDPQRDEDPFEWLGFTA